MTKATRSGDWQEKIQSGGPSPTQVHQTVHSGHFMVSELDDPEEDVDQILTCSPSGVVHDKVLATPFELRGITDGSRRSSRSVSCNSNSGNVSPAPKAPAVSPEDRWKFQVVGIDESLTALLKCMTLAYSGKITSPKWNHFRGLQLTRKDKIRLNNIIWREYHMQYVKKLSSKIVQFAAPLSESHAKPEAIVMEGKYWKRRNMAIAVEYQRWRRFTAHRLLFPHRAVPLDVESRCEEPMDISLNLFSDTPIPGVMDFMDNFDKFLDEQPLSFPDPRDIGHVVNADFVQPGLIQLQPSLEELSVDVIQAILQTPSIKPGHPKQMDGRPRGSSDPQPQSSSDTSDSHNAKFLPALLQMSSPSLVAMASSFGGQGNQSNFYSDSQTRASEQPILMETVKPTPFRTTASTDNVSASFVPSEHVQSQEIPDVSDCIVPSSLMPVRPQLQQDSVSSSQHFTTHVVSQFMPSHQHQKQLHSKEDDEQLKLTHKQHPSSSLRQPEQHHSLLHNQLHNIQPSTNQAQPIHGSLQIPIQLSNSVRDQSQFQQSQMISHQKAQHTLQSPLRTQHRQVRSQHRQVHTSEKKAQSQQKCARQLILPLQETQQQQEQNERQQHRRLQPTILVQDQRQLPNVPLQPWQSQVQQQAPPFHKQTKQSSEAVQPSQSQIQETMQPPQNQLQQAIQVLQSQIFQSSPSLQNALQQAPQPLQNTLKPTLSSLPSPIQQTPQPQQNALKQVLQAQPSPIQQTPQPQQNALKQALQSSLSAIQQTPQPQQNALKQALQSSLSPIQQTPQPQQNALKQALQSSLSAIQQTLPQQNALKQALQSSLSPIQQSPQPQQNALKQALQSSLSPIQQSPQPQQNALKQALQSSLSPIQPTQTHQQLQTHQVQTPFHLETRISQPSQSTPNESPRKMKKHIQRIIHVSPIELPTKMSKQAHHSSKTSQIQAGQSQQLKQETERPTFQMKIQYLSSEQQQLQQSFPECQTLFQEQVRGQQPSNTASNQVHLQAEVQPKPSPSKQESPLVTPERLHLQPYQELSLSSLDTPPHLSPGAQTSMDTSSGIQSSSADLGHMSPTRVPGQLSTEFKRRSSINAGFSVLQSLIPSLAGSPYSRVSKASLLHKSASLIRELKREKLRVDAEMAALKCEVEGLNNQISTFCSQLPDTGIAVSSQKANKGKEWFDAYVQANTLLNWKFYIFSLFIDELFNSYNNSVSLMSVDDFERTVNAWLEQHCSLIKLRPVVTTSLRRLSTSTAILHEPGAVPQQAMLLVLKTAPQPQKSSQLRCASGDSLKPERLDFSNSGDEDSDDVMLPPPPPPPPLHSTTNPSSSFTPRR